MILQSIIEQTLPHHPNFPEFAQKHAGKICHIRFESYDVFFQIHRSGLLFCQPQTADCTLSMNTASLLSLLGAHINGNIDTEGDKSLAFGLQKLMKRSSEQVGNILYHLLPDNLATALIEAGNLGRKAQQHSKQTLKKQIQFQLFDKLGLCASKQQLDQNYERIFHLRCLINQIKQSH